LVGSISALLGVVTGMAITYWFLSELFATMLSGEWDLKTQTDLATRAAVLEYIRTGQYDKAARQQEWFIDDDIIGAAEIIRQGRKLSPNALRAIEEERAGRAATGYAPSDPNMRRLVDDAWRTLDSDADPATGK
jgi:hypothetical protein